MAESSAKYLYAVIAEEKTRPYDMVGIEGNPIYSISNGKTSAIVSDFSGKKIRPERKNIAAHQEVLKQLMKEKTPLPMRFGIIVDDTEAIQKFLTRHQKLFEEQLEKVSGRVEMGLRVTWDVPNIFKFFVDTHPELRALRDVIFRPDNELTHDEKLEVGRTFEKILLEDRQNYTDKVEDILSPRCYEIKRNPARNEREVMNLVCLVDRDAQAEFEASVFEAAMLFDDNFTFDYNGPWAPHNFVELEIQI